MGKKAGIWSAAAFAALALVLLAINIYVIAGNWERQDEIERRQGELDSGAAVKQFSRRLRDALTERAPGDERLRELLRAEPP